MIIDGKFIDMEVIESENKYLRKLMSPMLIGSAVVCFIGLTVALPFAVMYDGYRSVKYRHIMYNKIHLN